MLNQNVFFLEDMKGAKPKRTVVLPPTPVAAKQHFFCRGDARAEFDTPERHPLKWAASLGAHAAVLFLLLLMPLYFSQGLDLQRFNTTLLVAAAAAAAAPPPPPPAAVARVVHTTPKTFTPGKLTAPSFVPKVVAIASDTAPPEEALMECRAASLAGSLEDQPGGVLAA